MSVHLDWSDADHKTMVYRFEGHWTLHEAKEALQTAAYLGEADTKPINYIYDLTQSRVPSRRAMQQMKDLITLALDPTPQQIIIVGDDLRMEAVVETLQHIVPHTISTHIQCADTMARAQAILQGNTKTL